MDDIIEDGKGNLQKALSKKNVDRELIQQALSKIEIGTERNRKFENDLDILGKKLRTCRNEKFFHFFIFGFCFSY